MKSNGALKPRQGASNQGSSPGVVLKKYRAKRYFKLNENVVISLPLNACGIKDKNLTQNAVNSNNIYTNNQQKQAAASLTHQLENKGKCGKKFCISINNSFCSGQITTTLKTEQHKSLTQSSVATATKTNIPVNNHRIRANTRTAAAEMLAEVEIEKNYEEKETIQIDFKQRGINDITTRRINDTKVNKKSKKSRINEINSGEKRIKQTVLEAALNTYFNNSHVNKYNNKLFSIPQINENLIMKEIISCFFVNLKLLLISMLLHAINYFNGSPFAQGTRFSTCSRTAECCQRAYSLSNNYFAKMMRVLNMLRGSFKRICFKNAWGANPSMAFCIVIYTATAILLPQPIAGEETDTFFPINGLETTTPEFDYASRGVKKFGDKCENTLECGFPGSICDPKKKSCQCTEDLPVTNHIDKCGKEAAVNESCFFNEQCEVKYFQTECRDQRCVCRFDMTPVWLKDGSVECKGRGDKKGPETYIDPAMIGVLIGMALMFIIICVVLRLFSQARWRENRTIFNTPNPRLMNVSLLRESKLLHGQERRGSRMSVRAPSRQPSMASLRPHSPNPSLGKTGSGSNSHGSNASATSLRSTRSNSVSPAGIVVAANNGHHERKGSTYHPHQHHHTQQPKHQPLQQQEQQHLMQPNIISNPVAETVTVEIIEPEK